MQGADAGRALELVGGKAHGRHVQFAEIDGQLADDLDGVGVAGDAGAVADCGDFGDGLQHAGFVVGQLHADQPGQLAFEQRSQLFESDNALRGEAEGVESPALFQKVFGGLDHALVFAG